MAATNNDAKHFCTGSSYQGQWDSVDMNGFGVYNFSDGSEYRGNFKNGVFDGEGTIILPEAKFRMVGNFQDGRCESFQMYFGDGLEYKESGWEYCQKPDRRYWSEVVGTLPPVGESFQTKERPPRCIPKRKWFDTEEGFFDPTTGFLLDTVEPYNRIRYLLPEERDWVVKHCRRGQLSHVGYDEEIAAETKLFANHVLDVKDDLFDVVWVSENEDSMDELDSDSTCPGRSESSPDIRNLIGSQASTTISSSSMEFY